jgi:hypothetical protein
MSIVHLLRILTRSLPEVHDEMRGNRKALVNVS